jgi:hypothetical protein
MMNVKGILLAALALTGASSYAQAAAPAKTRLPGHIVGLWCSGEAGPEGVASYLRNDASAPKPDTPCTKVGSSDWIEIGADGSYNGPGSGCKAVKLSVIYRGDVIKGTPGANAVYGVDARCEGEGHAWRERTRMEVERWGSALTIIKKPDDRR